MIFNSSLIIGLSLTSTANSPLLVFSSRYLSTSFSFNNLNFKKFSSYAFFDTSLCSLSIYYSRFTNFLNTAIMISNIDCPVFNSETVYDHFNGKCLNASYCTFQNIQSNSTGGAICIKWSEATSAYIDQCNFNSCTARSEGGAIYFGIYPVQFGILSATSSVFSYCQIDNIFDLNDVSGGAIYCHCEIINVSCSIFRNCGINSEVGNCRGGAIYADVCNAEKAFYLTVFMYCFVSRLPPPPTATPTQSPTPSFTPSDIFTASQIFTQSNSFTSSSHFTQSDTFSSSFYFTKSETFSKSIQFTKSSIFTKSEKFTKSSHFTKSSQFTKSSAFSKSKPFSPSNCFTKTSVFSKTSKFSASKLFSKSKIFTDSKRFTKSKEFTKSDPFSKSSPFTKSMPFTQTSHFSASQKFTKTEAFTKSVFFTKSNPFSKSNPFTRSSFFTKSIAFTKSEYFSQSEVFTLSMTFTPHPSKTPTETVPPESTEVPQSTIPPRSTKPIATTLPPTFSIENQAQLLFNYNNDNEGMNVYGIHLFNDNSRLVSSSEGGAIYLKLSENVHRTVDLYGTNFTGCSSSHGSALFAPDRIDLVLNSTRFMNQVTQGSSPTYSAICMNSNTDRNNSLYVQSVGISNIDPFNLIRATNNQLTFLNNPFDTGNAFAERVEPTREWFSKPPYPSGSILFYPYNQMPLISAPVVDPTRSPPPVATQSISPSLSPTFVRTPTSPPQTPIPQPTEISTSSQTVVVVPTASSSSNNADNNASGQKKSKLSPVAIFFIVLACLAAVIAIVWAICLYGVHNYNCRRKKTVLPDYHWREIEYF